MSTKTIKSLKKNPDMVSRVIDKETILVPVFRTSKDANYIYSLNPAAKKLWDLIDGKKTVSDIKEAILKDFDSTPKDIDKEISSTVKDLREIKAII
jgi:methyltransferase-like protein